MNNRYLVPAHIFQAFAKDEDGAVTVDWVVLTAAIVGLGVIVFSFLTPAIFGDAATSISDVLVWAAARP